MIVGNLTALFSLDSSNFDNGLRRVEEDTKKVTKNINGLGNEIGTTISNSGANLLGWAAALGTAFFVANKRIAQMIIEIESLGRTLAFVTGSAEAASEAFEFLEDLSKKLGISLEVGAKAFTQIAVAAKSSSLTMEQVKEIYTAMAEASAVLGLSSQRIELSFLAINQMISKGVISMEELRRQLGENLPGALGIMAKALGVTTAELNDMVSSGTLLADEVLPLFAKQLREEYGGAVAEISGSIQSHIAAMNTAWFKLKKELSSGALADAVAYITLEFTKLFNIIRMTTSAINSLYKAVKEVFVMSEDNKGITGSLFYSPGSIYDPAMKKEMSDFKKGTEELVENVEEAFSAIADEARMFDKKFASALHDVGLKGEQAIVSPVEAARMKIKAEHDAMIKDLDEYKLNRERLLSKIIGNDERYVEVLEEMHSKYGDAVEAINKSTLNRLESLNAGELLEDFSKEWGDQLDLAENVLYQFGDAVADWATGIDVSFSDMIKSIGKQLVAFTLKVLVIKPILDAFQESMMGFWSASKGPVSAFAGGGVISEPVMGMGLRSGSKYLLGESGPESVSPLSAKTGKDVNITINALDSKSVVELLRANPQAVTTPIVESLNAGDRGLTASMKSVLS